MLLEIALWLGQDIRGFNVFGYITLRTVLAALTALCSLVPIVGTLLVWVPLGVGLMIAGRVGAGRQPYSVAGRITTTDLVRRPESSSSAITFPSASVAA